MLIVVPTHRRTGMQNTLRAIPPRWRERTKIVCDQTDADIFAAKEGSTYEAQVVVYPAEEPQTIAAKRAWIIRNAVGGWLGVHDKLVMFDDDLRFSVRRVEGDTALSQADEDDVGIHLDNLSRCLDDYAHAGWSMRQGNNNKRDGYEFNTRMCYVLGYRPEVLIRECVLGRIGSREDMDYTLQLLRKGYQNILCNDIAVDQWSGYAAPGGCSAPDRIEKSNYDAFYLQEFHGENLVKVVYKNYDASVPRVEVRCYWKKALESAPSIKELGKWD